MLIAVVIIMAGVVSYLFKLTLSRQDIVDKERKEHSSELGKCREDNITDRAKCALEHETLRTETEEAHRTLVQDYAKIMKEERDEARKREDDLRTAHAERLERVAKEAAATSKNTTDVLDKIYEQLGARRELKR